MKYSKICIVDDNSAVCDSLKFLIESFFDVKVKVFQNPLLFLNEYSPHWKGCLIFDLYMPSMNGLDLLNELKKINSHLKVIIISGHGTQEISKQSLAAGAYAFITKPFNTEFLLKKIQTILELNA